MQCIYTHMQTQAHTCINDLGAFHWFPQISPFKNGVNESIYSFAKGSIYSNRTVTFINNFSIKISD